jgi:hypothetical protein
MFNPVFFVGHLLQRGSLDIDLSPATAIFTLIDAKTLPCCASDTTC